MVGSRADNVELAYSDARLASELASPAHGTLAWAEAQAELADMLRLRMAGQPGPRTWRKRSPATDGH